MGEIRRWDQDRRDDLSPFKLRFLGSKNKIIHFHPSLASYALKNNFCVQKNQRLRNISLGAGIGDVSADGGTVTKRNGTHLGCGTTYQGMDKRTFCNFPAGGKSAYFSPTVFPCFYSLQFR